MEPAPLRFFSFVFPRVRVVFFDFLIFFGVDARRKDGMRWMVGLVMA